MDEQVNAATLAHLEKLRRVLAKPPKREVDDAPPDFAVRRTKIAQSRARVVDAFSEGDISREDLRKRLAKLDADLAVIDVAEADHERLMQHRAADTPEARAGLAAKLGDMAAIWNVAAPLERREMLHILAERIAVDVEGTVAITWRDASALLVASV